MSSLIVKSVEFDVHDHPNADRLCIAKIRGMLWQCVINKDDWGLKPGDVGTGVYFPVDSILPEEMVKERGLDNILHKGRLKTVRFRGELSQGILLDIDEPVGEILNDKLGIKKYVQPIPISLLGDVQERPEGWAKYTGIENIKNFPNVLHKDEDVIVTEKLHGANLSVYKLNDEIFVSGVIRCWKKTENNSYWRALEKHKDVLSNLENGDHLFGELLGVQDLNYGFDKGHVGVRFFDLLRNMRYLDQSDFEETIKDPIVPILYRGPYDYEKIKELSSGKSEICDHIREGVVVKPVKERRDGEVGRVILKFISDDYLCRKGKKTEYI